MSKSTSDNEADRSSDRGLPNGEDEDKKLKLHQFDLATERERTRKSPEQVQRTFIEAR